MAKYGQKSRLGPPTGPDTYHHLFERKILTMFRAQNTEDSSLAYSNRVNNFETRERIEPADGHVSTKHHAALQEKVYNFSLYSKRHLQYFRFRKGE